MILGDPRRRVADEAQPPRLQIGDAAEIVADRAGQRIGIESVDGEVAPRRILAPVVGIGDGRAPAIGADVASQRRDLDRAVGQHRGDGAMVDAGRHRLDARLLQPIDHVARRDRRRDVEVVDRQAQQPVAHRTPDIARQSIRRA